MRSACSRRTRTSCSRPCGNRPRPSLALTRSDWDGSIWFTDPPYGIRGNYEGARAEAELPLAVYRVDGGTGTIAMVTDDIGAPNGLCFSPNHDRLYVADTGSGREIRFA